MPEKRAGGGRRGRGGGRGGGQGGHGAGGKGKKGGHGSGAGPTGGGSSGGGSGAPKEVIKINKRDAAQLSLEAVRRADKHLQRVLVMASHVVVYESFPGTQWERKDAEGNLFFVLRSKAPFFRILVLNRLSPTNFVVPITRASKLAAPGQYFMIRDDNSADKVTTGLWFHDGEERSRVCKVVKGIVGALERLAKVQVSQGAAPRLTLPIATEIAKAVVGAAAPPQPPAKPTKPAKASAPHTAKQPAPAPRKAPHTQPKPATTSTTRDGVRTVVNPGEDAGAVNSVAEALAVLAAQRAGGAKPTGNNRAGSSAPRDGGRNDAGAGAGSAPVAAPGGSGNLLTRQQLRDTLVSLLQEDPAFVATIHAAYLRGARR